jgi:hypothetical protein
MLYFTDLRCCCVCTQLLFDFTGLRCCCVCPTPIALFHRFKMLCLYITICVCTQLLFDFTGLRCCYLLCLSHTNWTILVYKHNNILSLWNQTILVYKHNNILCLWNQTILLYKHNNILNLWNHQLLYCTGLRCCCVFPTTIVWFHRLKMLLSLSHINCFISQV